MSEAWGSQPGVSPKNRAIESIRWYVRSRGLRPGAALPPERQLCRVLGVSRTALRGALATLEDSHFLTARQGSGTYVAVPPVLEVFQETPSFSGAARDAGRVPGAVVRTCAVEPADAPVAAKLSLEPGEPVFHLGRLRTLDGAPAALEEAWVRHALCPGVEAGDFTDESLCEVLWRSFGIRICHGDEAIDLHEVDGAEAADLDLAPGTPVYRFEAVERDAGRRPIEYGCHLVRPDRFAFASVRGPAWMRKRMDELWPLR